MLRISKRAESFFLRSWCQFKPKSTKNHPNLLCLISFAIYTKFTVCQDGMKLSHFGLFMDLQKQTVKENMKNTE